MICTKRKIARYSLDCELILDKLPATKWRLTSQSSGRAIARHSSARYSNAHNAEEAVDLYERADDGLRCCHGFAQNTIELCSRLLQVELDHGIII